MAMPGAFLPCLKYKAIKAKSKISISNCSQIQNMQLYSLTKILILKKDGCINFRFYTPVLFLLFEARSCSIIQAGLELELILLPQVLEYWDYKCMPPQLGTYHFLMIHLKAFFQVRCIFISKACWQLCKLFLEQMNIV